MKQTSALVLAAGWMFAALICCAQAPTKDVGPHKATLKPASPANQAPGPITGPVAGPAVSPQTAAHPLEQPDLEAFFDGILPLQLERSDIAGASVMVMQDGKILLKKGYGYADIKAKKAVDPDVTIFRLASISKLFTWISIMQLEEQGKLDLDTDINRYLDFQIRPAFNQPITLRNLMTHTGGFEEVLDDILLTDPKKGISLRDDLIQNQPMRLYPPGKIPAYSNYGVGLASYIVQRVSGEPFEQYVREHIFAPLGMSHSSFDQPLKKPLADLPSEGYRSDTIKPPVGFEIFNPVGAGGVSSTAADMGRFGQALLNGGELDGKRILKPETLALMWTPQFRASDQLPALCMGFYQAWRNDLRWIGHQGDLIAFHSMFFVEPKQKLVLFVSYNSASGEGKPRPEIMRMFSDRYFPSTQQPVYLKTPVAQLKAIEGSYQTTRRADSTKLKLLTVFDQTVASVDKDGVLAISGVRDLRGHPIKWKPTGKDLWQEVDGQNRIYAIRDGGDRVVRLAVDFPGVQLERVPWYEQHIFILCTAGASLAILAFVVVAAILRLGRRIFLRKRPRLEPQPGTQWLSASSRIAAFAWCILLGTIAVFILVTGDDLMPPTPDWFKWFLLMNWATCVALFFSFFAVIAGIRIWWRDELRWITKVKFTLASLACLILSWFAVHWNLIGPAHRI
ncbi:MAG TPA: serine hydrolase domain-containing protein [Terracidiphilus sp.]|nr:serine hydrolase domain-containing protein [Terracidiphilus sp.]